MFRVVVPPAVEPVTVEQALLWCRGACEEEAPLFEIMIPAARERAEGLTRRVFMQRTVEWVGPQFGGRVFGGLFPDEHYLAKLTEPRYTRSDATQLLTPTQSIESVKYLDGMGTETTVSPTAYVLDGANDLNGAPASIRYLPGFSVPSLMNGRADAVRIRFVAGYAADLTNPDAPDYRKNLPASLLQWMQITIATWYAQRESLIASTLVEAPRTFVDALLDPLILAERFF